MDEIMGQTGTYKGSDITITGYVKWGEPSKVRKVWFTYNSTGEAHSEGLVDIKNVTLHKKSKLS